ncbi:MAG: hypothetical protein WB615_05250 [Candidatus Tumulicola sp.]
MKRFTAISALAAVIVLAGCSSISPPISTLPATSTLRNQTSPVMRDGDTTVLYAAAGGIPSGPVWGYRLPSRKPFCNFLVTPGSQEGIGVDSTGTLWVPDGAETFSYAPDCGDSGTSLISPGDYLATNIAFGQDGTKYVLLTRPEPPFKGPNFAEVALYPQGATSPSGVLTDRDLTSAPNAVGLDSIGNVYVSCCELENRKHPKKPVIIVFKAGGSTKHGKHIPLAGMGETPSLSILFDQSKKMILGDPDHDTINVYAPPYTGQPVTHTFPAYAPGQCAFNRKKTVIACPDYGYGDIYVYGYPSFTLRYVLKPAFEATTGVAMFPPAPN